MLRRYLEGTKGFWTRTAQQLQSSAIDISDVQILINDWLRTLQFHRNDDSIRRNRHLKHARLRAWGGRATWPGKYTEPNF